MKSDFAYERLAQGEVTLPLTPTDQDRLDALKTSDQDFLTLHPVESLQVGPKVPAWSTALTLAAVLTVFIGLGALVPRMADQDTRVKSAALSLFVYHKTPTGTELLSPQARLAAGDEVQMAYFATGKRFAAILSVDGRGTVTTHLPLHGDQAVEIDTAKPELLPYSYKLDDAPDFETLVLVTSDSEFALSKLRPFLEADSASEGWIALPAEFESIAVRIAKKETSR